MTESEKRTRDELVEQINAWLEHPQSHLNDQSRRRVLEIMVADHVDKIRRSERARARGKDFLLFVSVATVIVSFLPRVYPFLRAMFE